MQENEVKWDFESVVTQKDVESDFKRFVTQNDHESDVENDAKWNTRRQNVVEQSSIENGGCKALNVALCDANFEKKEHR